VVAGAPQQRIAAKSNMKKNPNRVKQVIVHSFGYGPIVRVLRKLYMEMDFGCQGKRRDRKVKRLRVQCSRLKNNQRL
jgi:hypothetical protein